MQREVEGEGKVYVKKTEETEQENACFFAIREPQREPSFLHDDDHHHHDGTYRHA